MQQDNFKEQAQEIMGGFTIEPSERVWQHVQVQIGPAGKKRRWLLLFFTFLAIVTGTVFFFNGQNKNKITTNETVQKENSIKPIEVVKEQANISPSANEREAIISKQQTATAGKIEKKAAHRISYGVIKQAAAEYHHDITAVEINDESNDQKRSKEKSITETTDEASQYFEKGIPENSYQDVSKDATNIQVDNLRLDESAEMTMAFVNGTIERIDSKDLESHERKQISSTTHTDKAKKAAYTSLKKKRWFFTASVAAGKAFTGSGLFKNYAATDYSSIPNTGTSGSYYPSPLLPGVAFTVGGSVMYRLSAKTSLSVGLNYQLLQTSLLVGQKAEVENADGTKSLRFGAGSSHKYTNNNHHISLQAGVMLPVFKVGNNTGYFKSGVTVSQLIHSNALQFNFSQATYYIDNSSLHKTIAGLFSGIALDITGRKQKGWLIGPEFYYGLSSNATTGMYGKSHTSFWGIGIQKIFRR